MHFEKFGKPRNEDDQRRPLSSFNLAKVIRINANFENVDPLKMSGNTELADLSSERPKEATLIFFLHSREQLS
jgi:hypothetical protein